ncbi:MAG TPA: AIR synthase family protein [Chloroflexota bacterium]|nr:AIR synthase family protein [Chloroflexota bacterium]
MRPGKLTPAELADYVFPHRGVLRKDVLVHAAFGQDTSVVEFGDEVAVLSTDPITGAGRHAGWLAVQIASNDVAVSGAVPVGVLITLLLARSSAAHDAQTLMEDADRAAQGLGAEILGGHSEVTDGLVRSLVVVTALGRARRDRFVNSAGARPGDAVLLTKSAGLEGTAVLASDFATALSQRLPPDALEKAQSLIEHISVVPEALAAAAVGVSAMHDATEGGVLGALAELAGAAGVAVDVDVGRIPVLPETRAICDALGIDPLGLVSSGALLIATSNAKAVVRAVRALGVQVVEIGRVVSGPSQLREGGVARPLVPPDRDALWEAIERTEKWSERSGTSD